VQHAAVISADRADTLICPGDELKLSVVDTEELDGLYTITAQGLLELPFMDSIHVAGLTSVQVTKQLETTLVTNEWFYQGFAKVSASIVRLAPVQVSVRGAVFNPGRVTVNQRPLDAPQQTIDQSAGDYELGRDLTAALRAAGGVRPDAKLDEIYLQRAGTNYRLDLSALLEGDDMTFTPALMAGDQIIVASTGYEDARLIRTSQITPPGMRVFMSNLTAPAMDNANSAIGNDATRLPYGVTLLESAVAANCIGGAQSTNATRSVLLITRHHGDQTQVVIKRKIDDLLGHAADTGVNPYLMPNDAIACYDSKFTNFRDIARGLSEILAPIFFTGALL
jgi:protein involved in polysaccharide export with SLBB domain